MITFRCACGQALQVKEKFAGRKIRCPACQAIATAAGPEAIQPADAVPASPRP